VDTSYISKVAKDRYEGLHFFACQEYAHHREFADSAAPFLDWRLISRPFWFGIFGFGCETATSRH